MASTIPSLRTPRLVLRPFTPGDGNTVQRLAGDRDIAATTASIPHPYQDGMAQQWIAAHQERFTKGEAVTFAITLASTGDLVGAIGIEIRREHARGELGYWIGKPYWNNGYCTEAAFEALRYSFQVLGLSRIYACHFKSNEASGRVMRKLGMTREGEFRRHLVKWGVPQGIVFYGILNSEFEGSLPGI
jgi:[ribosomal protein S5]-alanine N-acetyltransferase